MPAKKCKHCGKPVGKTLGNKGYCKKCIALARAEQLTPVSDDRKL